MRSTLGLNDRAIRDYLEDLAKAGDDIDAIAEEALDAGAEVLRAGMERRAPKLSGNLKGKIQTLNVSDGNYHVRKVGVYAVDRASEMYFFYQENGSPRNPAHPYIRSTFHEDWKRAKARMIEVFKARKAVGS